VSIGGAEAVRWQIENRLAVVSSNRFVARYGLPLAGYRQF
jgi:post-segregation antitoxin (ccd killing protein)